MSAMLRRLFALLTTIALGLAGLFAPAQADTPPLTLYIAPSGDDSSSGTLEEPLQTLEGARDAIRTHRADGTLPDGPVTVYLREGSYYRTQSFELGAEDSGTAESPVTYASYPGETARLTGGLELDRDDFAPVTDDAVLDRIVDVDARDTVLQLDLDAAGITDYGNLSRHGYWYANDLSEIPPMELFVEGEGMTLARWPNNGDTVQMDEIIDVGPTRADDDLHDRGGVFSFTYDRPQHWAQAEDIWMDGIFGYSWEWSYNKVASIDLETKQLTMRYGEMSGLMKTWFEDFHHFENLLEELDSPGEYYVDRDAGILYFQPNAGFQHGTGAVTVSMLSEPMLRTDGASHVVFDELVLEYGRALAAVILGGEAVTISSSDIRNFTDGGVYINSPGRYTYDGIPVNRGGTDHTVVDSHIQHVGGVAVVLQGGDKTLLTPGNNRVVNTHIHDFAYYHQAYNPGVMLDGVGNAVEGSEIHDAPHPGIIVHGNDHLIERNEIYDICKRFQDLGAIYMNAGATPQQRGTVMRGNYFHDTGIGRLGVEGIYPDNLTMGLTIEGNYFYRMGNDAIKVGSGSHITARNNVFIDTFIPFNNYEMWMGDHEGNKVDTDYMPTWIELFEENNDFIDTPYGERYPELLTFFEENHYYPDTNVFENNVTWNPGLTRSADVNAEGARDVHDLLNYGENWVTDTDPGFVDPSTGDFTFADDAPVFEQIPGFEPTPFGEIGTQGTVGHPSSPTQIDVSGVYLPAEQLTLPLGSSQPFAAQVVPWNASEDGVTYVSSDPAAVEVDATGTVTALAPGEATVTATSAGDAAIVSEARVVVVEGDGILHFTDFESGGNDWPIDPNRSIVADADGNHVYRIVNGANSQHPRPFGEYTLRFQLTTPEVMPEGGVLLMYDRTGANAGGFIEYRHAEAGPRWRIYDSGWAVLEEVVLAPEQALEPSAAYEVAVTVAATGVTVAVDGDAVIAGPNPNPGTSGKVGFYVSGFSHLDVDDVTFSLVRTAPESITIAESDVVLAAGGSRQLTATLTPSDATAALTWESSDPSVVTVDALGRIRAVAPGSTTVTVTVADDPTLIASIAVEVVEGEYVVTDLTDELSDADGWVGDGIADFDGGTLRLTSEGVIGYEGATYADGLLRFNASFGAFEGGWYGFAVRSDRAGTPSWVGSNKGYLVVIKEDVIEIQSWRPGQSMLDVVPNTTITPDSEHVIEFGTTATDEGMEVVLRVDGVAVWSGLDTGTGAAIAEAGYLNVYHYAETGTLTLTPAEDEEPEPPEHETDVDLRVSVRSQCWDEEAVVAVHAVNRTDLPADIRLTTPYGDKKFTAVQPGQAVYHGFTTGGPSVGADSATVAGYSWHEDHGHYQRYTVSYEAVTCG
ncbi:Ig-like domain-containing protein [Pseudactinotalea terrae]|uniref:Ig-like domain-containing protein n=1 Tax=Pseudactinotalea terrae TaxID=1743262 RepID=UPI001F4F65E2|nr:Ig-like domain-containing protein [Pseudactinotalea terrae]